MSTLNKNALKNTVSCALFLVILFNLFCNITWLFRGNGTEAREDIQGFKNRNDIDVVLLGGSTALRYYNPLQAWKEKGITAYNYATSWGKFDLLKDYIEDSRKTNEAQLYVVNVRTIALLTPELHEQSLRNWSDSLDPTSLVRVQGINDFVFPREWDYDSLPSFYFDIIKYHSNREALASESQWSFLDPGTIQNLDKGFAPYTENRLYNKLQWGDQRGKLSDLQNSALQKMLDYCDREKIQVLFVCCPFIYSDEDTGVINTCGDIISQRGYAYLNCNEHVDEMGIDYLTDFNDSNHVNYNGAVKYTRYLTEYMASHFDLTDHRGDPEYSQWDEDYEAFLPTMKKYETTVAARVKEKTRIRDLEKTLKEETDFYGWYSKIRDKYTTVIIRMKKIPKNLPSDNVMFHFMKEYSISPTGDSYVGIWTNKKAVVSKYNDLSAYAEIGSFMAQREKVSILAETGDIHIGEADYTIPNADIQIIVFNRTYNKVIDSIAVTVKGEHSVVMRRK